MTKENMTFWDHLEVLRWSLLRVAIVAVVALIVVFSVMPHVFSDFILGPTSSDFFLYKWLAKLGNIPFMPDFAASDFKVDIININVASQFMTHISASFWLGLVLIFPYLLYEIWKFVSPALYQHEKGNVRLAFVFGTLMFYLGCAISYSFIFPFTFRFLTEYQLSQDIVNQISLNSYMSTFYAMIFLMGLVFELPLLAWLLSKLGLITKEFLKSYRKHAVVILLILAAVITPTGDPLTLALVFTPLFLLYQLSIYVVKPSQTDNE